LKKSLQRLIPKLIGAKINSISIVNPAAAAQQSFNIFCTPRKGRPFGEQIPYLEQPKFEKLDSGSCELQSYHWEGTGKKVLLIHGWESNTYRWYRLIEDLQKENYDIYAIDAPAHGYSTGNLLNVPRYAQAIETAINAYKPDHIIGHSIGGLATVFHQFTYKPEGLTSAVILGSASELAEIMVGYKAILGLNNRTMTALEKLVKELFGYNFKEFSGAAFAKSLTLPALIIHDKYDKITPVSASQNIHKNWKGSTYIETEGYGHSLYQEEVRKHIVDFLA
jgi:pimeloyl-ACP methyl ester carboxylesterase